MSMNLDQQMLITFGEQTQYRVPCDVEEINDSHYSAVADEMAFQTNLESDENYAPLQF